MARRSVLFVFVLLVFSRHGLHAAEILGVEPSLCLAADREGNGGTAVVITGTGFRRADAIRVGGANLLAEENVSDTRITGRIPFIPEGFHSVELFSDGVQAAILDRAVEVAPRVTLSSVTPRTLSRRGGEAVTVEGSGFREATTIRFGTHLLLDAGPNRAGTAITGTSPALSPAEPNGPYDVVAEDSRGRAILPGGVAYQEPPRPPALPGPQLVETALAQGKARFEWENLFAYDEIQVLDEEDRVVARLPGDATRFEMDTGGSFRVARKVRGSSADLGLSAASAGVAIVHQCTVPPPLIGLTSPGELEFTLYGGHSESGDEPCADGGGGGIALQQFAHPMNGLGHLQTQGGSGYVVQETALLDLDAAVFRLVDSNKLTTGFTLEEDADKLEMKGFFKKVGVAAGLELRGRLIHVFPNDGFVDEFTFPETLAKADKEWHPLVYFRSYLDGGGARQPCLDGNGKLKKIPAGEYLLDFYAIGGDPKLPYFTFADDPLDLELLIQGSPCPPYPMVRVTDLTGLRTVPTIACMDYEIATYPGNLFGLSIHIHAQGTWTDFDNSVYRIHQDTQLCAPTGPPVTSPLKNSPDFEYSWTIFQKDEVPVLKCSGNSPTLYYHGLPDWGCYKVELTVRDKKCGLESKFSQELAVYPASIACNAQTLNSSTCKTPQVEMKSAYMFPTPDPKNIYGVVGLKAPAPGSGKFEGERPVEMRVLVVPCHCGDAPGDIESCPSPSLRSPNDPGDDDVQFRLAIKEGSTYTALQNANIVVTDPCDQVVFGPKYLNVRIADIGAIPHQPALGQFTFKPVYFQARNRTTGGTIPGPGDPAGCWRNIGSPLRLSNRPDALTVSIWSGHFEPGDASYHFIAKSSKDTEQKFELGSSQEMPIDVPDVDVAVPSYQENDVATGFTSRFMAIKGKWYDEDATGGMSGNTLGNDLQGEPLQVKGSVHTVPGSGGGAILGTQDLPYYEWCHQEEIFKNKFSTTLFESIIYTGTIGPVPVTVWASIGLGLDFLIEAYAYVKVSPFAVLDGGNYLETYFDLYSQIDISIPCEVRADILAGLASIAMRLRPEATFKLQPYFDLKFPQYASPVIDYYLGAFFSLYFEIEACIQTFIFGEQCFSPGEITLIDHEEIFPTHGTQPQRPPCSEGGGGLARGEERGEGAGVLTITGYETAVAPVTLISPDRATVVDIWVKELQGTLLQMRVNEVPVKSSPLALGFYLIDPSAAFVSNGAAMVAWTQPAHALDPEDLPEDKEDPEYLIKVNENAATAEIRVATLHNHAGAWGLFDASPRAIDLLDDPAGVAEPDWRADGKPSVAGDLSSGEALVAWVRYDTHEFMVKDGVTEANLPCPEGQICLCGGFPPKPCDLYKTTVPRFRPQIEKTAIFVRRVGFTTEVVQPGNQTVANSEVRSQAFKISPPGINIEPSISTAPSGEKSYCVWLHDPTHEDLLESNRGRQILLSIYTKNMADLDDPAQWSAPQGALAAPDDYPALLEPRIYLKGNDQGLLVFTALDKTAPVRDSGLGVGRYLYGVRLEGGVLGEPFRVHGKCFKRQYGYGVNMSIDIPDLIDPLSKLKWKNPEWVMVFQELGEVGTRTGSGNVKVTTLAPGSETWSPPVNLTPDANIHSNVTGLVGPAGVHTVHLDGGPASFQAFLGRGAGLGAAKEFVVSDTPLAPDPAITGCRLDFPFASPGSEVTATIEVSNDGLISTPVAEDTGASALALEVVLVDDGGRETITARATVPELEPGEKTRLDIGVEMPLDPVRFRAQLLPGPRDLDRTNNVRECPLGAPPPMDFACETVTYTDVSEEGEERATAAVLLSWSNPVVYDEVLIYRDGRLIAGLPGRCSRWIDSETRSGVHGYAIRGRILVSKSLRAECTLDVVVPEPSGELRRGDVDGNSIVNITDPIALLGYLYLGSREPGCPDAADADDNAGLEITDAIRILNFLFLGGPDPASPGPFRCGPDVLPDDLGPCEGVCR